eukprot:CAMPEP_0175073376 /NCGR_PEP_ID=MMETSP0052_2-20121109/20515_1 /TAXON_ID=51329 ORGANISM="Polytomella parva, Strain SAG 63-3" /NCGR_SAMPLE_ID=MMETSP0052_2 /ASSEMBLY_ACC=CAM_ASM_000194 /LENGTH=34 /DNA_ID= /DNA_START= /DNA_END= /DNA_ORIENTATION=
MAAVNHAAAAMHLAACRNALAAAAEGEVDSETRL